MHYFGEKLRELRVQHNMSQKELAEKLGIVSGTVSAYEQDKKRPSLEVLVKICRIFSISSDYLLGLNDNMNLMKASLTDYQMGIIRQLIRELEAKNE